MRKVSMGMAVLLAGVSASTLARADVIVGNWEAGSSDQWLDWGTQAGYSGGVTNLPAPKYTFSNTTGVTLGSSSLHLTQAGYNQNLAVKLEYLSGGVADFYNNDALKIDITYPAQTLTSGFQQIYELAINAQGYGFQNSGLGNPIASTSVGFGGPTGDQTITLTYNYSALLARNGGPIQSTAGWAEFIFSTNGDSGHPDFYFDNARLVVVPEPASAGALALLAAGVMSARRKR